jgi:hypothetical protein
MSVILQAHQMAATPTLEAQYFETPIHGGRND